MEKVDYNSKKSSFIDQISLFISLLLFLTFLSCNKDDNGKDNEYILVISPSEMTFQPQKDTCKFSFTVLKDGKRAENYALITRQLIFDLPDWCEFEYNDAEVGNYLRIVAKSNTNEQERSAIAKVYYKDLFTSIHIQQNGASDATFVKLESDTIDIETLVKFKGFHIKSDGNWSIENIPNWCTIEPSKGNGNDFVRIAVTNNEFREKQEAIMNILFSKQKELQLRLWTREEVLIHKSRSGLESDLSERELFGSTRTLKLKGPMYTNDFFIFNKISSLEAIDLSDTYIASKTGEIPSNAFSDCSLLKDIIFPKDTYSIGQFAFSRCTSLENIIIPEKIIKVSYYAFSSCRNLKKIDLPSSIKIIENGVFSSAILNEIKCRATTPPQLNTLFTSNIYNSTRVIVPKGCIDKYKTNSNWGKFKNIIEE